MVWESLTRCWPELLGIILSIVALRGLLWLNGVRLRLGELRRLHADQVGGVQSLSFVLTVPLFIFIMLFIVQLSQLTIAKVVVEYSAFAAARSAVVWIPADTLFIDEGSNRISERVHIGEEFYQGDDTYWLDDERPQDLVSDQTWGTQRVDVYRIVPGSPKYRRIHLAAAMACLSISPSRDLPSSDVGDGFSTDIGLATESALKAYLAHDQNATENPRIPSRLRNKIAYALNNTEIDVEVRHKDSEPPLWYLRTPLRDGFWYNEIGWQDQVTVTVTHHFALLPGPGRLLARRADARPGEEVDQSYAGGEAMDSIAQQIGRQGQTYVYSITSTCRLSNEGHVPSRQFTQTYLSSR